jgi:hypothetical protein
VWASIEPLLTMQPRGTGTRNGAAPPASVPQQNFARGQEPPPDRGTLAR